MSSISLHFHGPIDRRGLAQDQQIAIEPGTTIDQLLASLGYPALQRKVILANVAGEQRKLNHVLRDGDVLEIFVVASGG